MSWNVLRQRGATPQDVAHLARKHRADIVLLQEASDEFAKLTTLMGGHWKGRRFEGGSDGLGAWSANPFGQIEWIDLPTARGGRWYRPRLTMVLQLQTGAIANVHLSHGQRAVRRQLRIAADAVGAAGAVIGNMNMIGPSGLGWGPDRWRDAGPKAPTHTVKGILPLRLDRCLVKGWQVKATTTLDHGPSDHCPIVVDLLT
jgi:endonuclease/exonuclease/phosphatase family metal-dependent hydrolase